jgi:oligoendopeptidase F
VIAPPESPNDLAQATWEEIEPHYERLAEQPLDDVGSWLREWSRFEEILSEAYALAAVAYTCDMADPAKEAANLRFSRDIGPRAREQNVRLGRRLLSSGYTTPDLEMTLRRIRNQEELFREANVPLFGELQSLASDWQKLAGGLSAEWEGQRVPLPALRIPASSPDRQVREQAIRLHLGAYAAKRDAIADIFDREFEVRQTVARNAGTANYRDYVHAEKNRFDYTPADCLRFHGAVEQTIVPAVERIMQRRRELMKLDSLRPWDAIDGMLGSADPVGRPALRPFSSSDELTSRAQTVFSRVDPELGDYFGIMREESLLDLDSRSGKAPGGYCTTFPFRKRPFIFMNATGIDGDVRTLLHEAGHAFHSFEVHRHLPLTFQRHPGSEMAEVASMSMELLAAPYLSAESGGYFSPEDQRRSRIDHLEGILIGLAHIAAVDAFQQWIYTTDEGADRDARDRTWLRLRDRFMPGVDWSGLEDLRVGRWLMQPHIFMYPFYYIEYGIAQLGALQVWRNALSDQAGAVAAYRRALKLGATRPLPELLETAGARLVFDAETMGQLVGLVEAHL